MQCNLDSPLDGTTLRVCDVLDVFGGSGGCWREGIAVKMSSNTLDCETVGRRSLFVLVRTEKQAEMLRLFCKCLTNIQKSAL